MDATATVATLLIVGALLLAAETVLPGMIAGIVGFGLVVAGVVMGYIHFGPDTGTRIFVGVIIGLTAGTIAWFRYFPNSRAARMFISPGVVGDIGTERPELLNQTGHAITRLRPCGTAVIAGKRIDVVSEGPMIEPETPVKVVAVEGMKIVVRAV
ncbi:MAG: NfeD family protein [Verrucomicrobiota bacterium]